MSRRAKLLITALFIVLLGIPAVFAILTWSIEPPLRFRCIAALPEEMVVRGAGSSPEPYAPFIIEVRNPNPFTVGFYGMAPRRHLPELRRPNGYYPTISCSVEEVRDESTSSPGSGSPRTRDHFMPPHGVQRLKVLVRAREAAHFEAGTVDIGYNWASWVRMLACDACEWAHPKLPDSLRSSIGYVYPQYGGATLEGVPIKLPRTATAPAPAPYPSATTPPP